MDELFDVVIVGGGPGGLAAALALGRARKRVLVCDAGERRNAAADRMHNFVTRDGTPPSEFRAIARAQLATYPNVVVRDVGVLEVSGASGAFVVRLSDDAVRARRILLCTGMIDELPALDGLREIWGHTAIICPYCHGWEVQDRRFAYLAKAPEMIGFAAFLRGWSSEVVALTNGAFAVPAEQRALLERARVRIEERAIARLIVEGTQLQALELADGDRLARDVLFMHPHQKQVPLVATLGLATDDAGYLKLTDGLTSRAGIYAAGDLATQGQSAINAANAAVYAVARLNHELTIELVTATPPA